MSEPLRRESVSEPLRCSHCGDVIGVYEPLIELAGGRARETSLAAQAPSAGGESGFYHRACYGRGHSAGPPGE
jgi:hypothetical protein